MGSWDCDRARQENGAERQHVLGPPRPPSPAPIKRPPAKVRKAPHAPAREVVSGRFVLEGPALNLPEIGPDDQDASLLAP